MYLYLLALAVVFGLCVLLVPFALTFQGVQPCEEWGQAMTPEADLLLDMLFAQPRLRLDVLRLVGFRFVCNLGDCGYPLLHYAHVVARLRAFIYRRYLLLVAFMPVADVCRTVVRAMLDSVTRSVAWLAEEDFFSYYWQNTDSTLFPHHFDCMDPAAPYKPLRSAKRRVFADELPVVTLQRLCKLVSIMK